VQWPRPRVEDLEDLYMPGEWPLARLKEPVQSMLAPLQSCVCINSMDGWVRCLCRHIIAHGPQSPFQLAEHLRSMGSNMQRPLPANQPNWLKTVWAGWG